MTSHTSTERMVLFVHAATDLEAALAAVGQILARRRREEPHLAVELYGAWVDSRLDQGMPPILRSGASCDPGSQAEIVVHESFSLAGVWSLCWIDGPSLSTAPDAGARQRIVVDALAGAARRADVGRNAPQYYPVFPGAMDPQSVRVAFRELRARHPGTVGPTWFLLVNEDGGPRFRSEGMVAAGRPQGPRVAVIMGSKRDWPTMSGAVEILAELGIAYEAKVVSAHRTPDLLFEYVAAAEKRGIQVIVAGAGGAAHLPGMTAAKTTLPVLGVPVGGGVLHGVDSLLSIVQMPKGVPVGTLAIGAAGAANAALLAAAVIALGDAPLRERLKAYRARQTAVVLEEQL